jgi:NOL1/NOP2/sun family putative RNA methylase
MDFHPAIIPFGLFLCYTELTVRLWTPEMTQIRNCGLMNLPGNYLENMKALLKDEYVAWREAMDQPSYQGLRINTMKLDPASWEEKKLYPGERVPWTVNGFYYDAGERPALDPYYYAGLYYLQEPSAMTPAAMLDVQPGDKVLDLCAAPGGKSTELGAKLRGQGLLVSNDISNTRARALLKNLELFGIPNILVTSEAPEKLADTFGAYFDKILVDAPCSGEGMFRKDPDLIKSWMDRGPEEYAPIQKQILKEAVRMLRPGGYLLYSTCTFAKIEDEDVIHWILEEEPEMELAELPLFEGAARGLGGEPVIRLFPHKIHGEGHFVALLHKKETDSDFTWSEQTEKSENKSVSLQSGKKDRKSVCQECNDFAGKADPTVRQLEKESDFLEWESLCSRAFDRSRMMIKDNLVYLLPEGFQPHWKLRYLRSGLLLGEWKKKRFEPSQAAAMAMTFSDFSHCFSMKREDERVIRYLKGETIFLKEEETLPKGWILVCVDGFPLGWAKYTGSSLKNKYYAGWRWQS